jgi:integrase
MSAALLIRLAFRKCCLTTCLNTVMGKVQEGSWRPDTDVTVKQLLEEHWLPAKRSENLRPSTLAQYQNAVTHWIVPNLGGIKAKALRPIDVQNMVERMRNEKSSTGRNGLSARSTQVAVMVLKSACSWAVEDGILGRNPVATIKRPRVEAKAMTSWSVADARAFLAATSKDRLTVGWTLLLTRGIRRGELCGLKWGAVDLEGGVIKILSTRVVVDGKAITSSPKTSAGKRSVPLDASLVTLLRTHRTKQAAERLAAGEAYSDGGYVLADEIGVPYHPDTVSDWFEREVKAAKLPRIRLHDTRHTAASLMQMSNVAVFASFHTVRDEVPPGDMDLSGDVAGRSSRDEALVGPGIHQP